jgi:hypothetical protein
MFKNVALNFPSSRAGPADNGSLAPASRLSKNSREQPPSKTLSVFHPPASKHANLSGRNIGKSTRYRTFYLDELHDLYDAENQLIKALPKMAGIHFGRIARRL